MALGNGITLQQGNIFSFILVNGTHFGEQVTSPLFTIQAKSSSATTSSALTSSSTATPSTSTSASSTQAASATTSSTTSSSPTSSSTASSGLSTGAKVGVGVAVPGVALVAIGAALMFFSRRRRARAGEAHYIISPNSDQDLKNRFTGIVEAPAPYHRQQQQQIHEAPPGGVYEVPG